MNEISPALRPCDSTSYHESPREQASLHPEREIAEKKAREEADAAAARQAEADRLARVEAAAKLAARENELAELRAKLDAMQAAQKPAEPEKWSEATKNAVLRQEGTPKPVDGEFTLPPTPTEKPLEHVTDADPGDEAAPVKAEAALYSRDAVIDLVASSWFMTAHEAESLIVELFVLGGAK